MSFVLASFPLRPQGFVPFTELDTDVCASSWKAFCSLNQIIDRDLRPGTCSSVARSNCLYVFSSSCNSFSFRTDTCLLKIWVLIVTERCSICQGPFKALYLSEFKPSLQSLFDGTIPILQVRELRPREMTGSSHPSVRPNYGRIQYHRITFLHTRAVQLEARNQIKIGVEEFQKFVSLYNRVYNGFLSIFYKLFP